MIHELDATIKALLTQEMRQVQSNQVEVSFEQPNREWIGRLTKTTLNFFLYDIRENPVLRQHQWQTIGDSRNGEPGNDMVRQQRTPLRVDCFYLVTAWSRSSQSQLRPIEEHELLAECLMTLARYPILNQRLADQLAAGREYRRPGEEQETPEQRARNRAQQAAEQQQLFPFLVGALAQDEHEIRTRLANHDVMTNPAELWGSLDNDIRAGFSYVVNLPLDPWQKIVQQAGETGSATILTAPPQARTDDDTLAHVPLTDTVYERPSLIGGMIKKLHRTLERQPDGSDREEMVGEAWPGLEVWVVEKGLCERTDKDGRFVFRRIPAGQYTIEVHEPESGKQAQHERTVPGKRQQSAPILRQTVTVPSDRKHPMRPIVLTIDLTKLSGIVTQVVKQKVRQSDGAEPEQETRQPYAGVEVRLLQPNVKQPLAATTDAQGRFVLPRPAAKGVYSVEVWKGKGKKPLAQAQVTVPDEKQPTPLILFECA
jgi:hypothetical protein